MQLNPLINVFDIRRDDEAEDQLDLAGSGVYLYASS
jgi:hypothetical protein